MPVEAAEVERIVQRRIDELVGRIRNGQLQNAHAGQHRRGGPDVVALPTVEEADGSPSIRNVQKFKFPTGTVTDNADGSVSVATGAGSGALTVQEEDASPSDTAVTVIKVPNTSLTVNGAGNISLGYELAGVAAAHVAASDPHTGYVLESAHVKHTYISFGAMPTGFSF